MSNEPKDGGPAFPVIPPAHETGRGSADGYPFPDQGMSLRDWFAGQVLASAAALPFGDADCEHRARVAYRQADAMLAARSLSA